MRKAWLVAVREYLENARTKTFWFGILMMPIMIVLISVLGVVFEKAKDVRRYGVVDQSGWLLSEVDERAQYDDLLRLFRLLRSKAEDGELEELPELLRGQASMVAEADDEQLENMAKALSAGAGGLAGAALPSDMELPPDMKKKAGEVAIWMATLSPKDARSLGGGLKRGEYERVSVPEGTEDPEGWFRTELEENRLFAYFVIGDDPQVSADGCKYVSKNHADSKLHRWFQGLATEIVQKRRFEEKGIDQAVAAQIQERLRFESNQLSEDGAEEKVKAKDRIRQAAPVVFTYLLWMAIMVIANMLMTNTIEEKSNRIIEVLLSSVSPLQLMAGKVGGIAATGLTMVGSWVIFFLLGLKLLPHIVDIPAEFDLSFLVADPILLGSFVFYFIAGYMFYAALLVGIGSICNSLKEAQNFMAPVMLLMFIPLGALMPIAADPNGKLARVLSYIPPFTPYTMMNRAAGPPSTFDYVATTVILVVAICLAFWAAAKVFRIGILMTGKPPSPTEILRWIGTPVGSVPERKE